ncbi:transcription elongation factor GreAB [Pseudoalteromonas sp. SMS1]|uniref:transcription elongation factor GreAB n=1 Tax=Pseudoalteromonas sp. SMS1 TaxID=2908894 RepID=UPI001F3A189F|nr:transcription elongation factor GreAB [Pseudoalteromonas sp. SMS1]MCF2858171.1 transcription elongation factor GreAB [Pseudoalteromonas sp. SMS1]
MKKIVVIEALKFALEGKLYEAKAAADSARQDAIHEQSAAETQYDSLSIESGYLAEGQSERVEQAIRAIHQFEASYNLNPEPHIVEGALVQIADEAESKSWYYIGPAEGGLKIQIAQTQVMVLTVASPLGQVLYRKCLEDEIEFNFNGRTQYLYVDAIL